VVGVPAINLRKSIYDELIRKGFDPTVFMNEATKIVLEVCEELGLSPESSEDTEQVVQRVAEKIREWLALEARGDGGEL
jgi:hypothetical protein